MTEAGAALVALAVTAVTAGAASTAAGAITGAVGVGSSAAMNAAIQAGVQALINKSAVALINNRGDIAGALHELGSSKTLLSIVSSMVTAGLTSQLTNMAGVGQSLPKTAPFVERIAHEAEKNLIKASIGAGVQTVLEGGSLEKNFFTNLRTALSDTIGKTLAEEIGTAKAEGKIDTITQIVAHAGLGCLKGAIANGACSSGAVGGAVGEATAMLQFKLWVKGIVKEEMGDLKGRTPTPEEQAGITARIDAEFASFRENTINVARAAGGFAVGLAGGDVNTGADAAGNAAENNYLSSAQQAQKKKELEECPDKWCRRDVEEKWLEIDDQQDVFFSVGVVAGAPAELYETAQGFWQMVRHPIETLEALKELVTSGNVTETIKQSYLERIHYLEEEYQRAGISGSFHAGVELGKLLTEAASLVAGGAGLAKGGIKLIGKLTEKTLAKLAVKAEKTVAKAGSEVSQTLGKMSDEAIATQYLRQERKFWSVDPIEVEFEMTYKGEKITQKNKVYQRDDLFDPNRISEWKVNKEKVTGTNIERMKAGRAPIGFDGKSVELHHMLQTPDGPIAEVSRAFHKKHTSIIHINPNTMESAIDRDMFGQWREEYWKERAKGYIEHEKNNLTEKNP